MGIFLLLLVLLLEKRTSWEWVEQELSASGWLKLGRLLLQWLPLHWQDPATRHTKSIALSSLLVVLFPLSSHFPFYSKCQALPFIWSSANDLRLRPTTRLQLMMMTDMRTAGYCSYPQSTIIESQLTSCWHLFLGKLKLSAFALRTANIKPTVINIFIPRFPQATSTSRFRFTSSVQ
jgi:hypothetical protein